MSEHDDPVQDLLDLERDAPGMPDDVAGRLASRLSVALPPAVNGSPPPSPGHGAGSGPIATAGPAVLSAARWLQLGLAFALGAGSGVAIDRQLHPPAEPPTTTARPEREIMAPEPAVPDEVPADPPTAIVAEPVPVEALPSPPSVAPSPEVSSSDAERLWLERAEAAFASGDAGAALAALESHARRFPRGSLSEERDALRIRALYLAGRTSEADERRERFLVAHPRSVFTRQFERARARGPEGTHAAETEP